MYMNAYRIVAIMAFILSFFVSDQQRSVEMVFAGLIFLILAELVEISKKL